MRSARSGLWGAWAPAVVWLGVIWTVNSLPRQTFPEGIRESPRADPQAHLLLYLPLGVFLMRALLSPGRNRAGVVLTLALTVALGAALAALDEWHKVLIPARRGEVGDWFRDVVGICVGACGWAALVAGTASRDRPQPAVGPGQDGG